MDSQSYFNNLDYVVIVIVLLSGLFALFRGFARELFSLAAWVGAYFVGTRFYEPVIPFVQRYIANERAAEWGAMACVFVGTLALLSILGFFIASLVKGRAMTSIDRGLGFIYGLARGVLVVSLVYLGCAMILWPDIDEATVAQQEEDSDHTPPEILMNAKTRPIMAASAKFLMTFAPKEMIDEQLKSIDARRKGMEQVLRNTQEMVPNLTESFDASNAENAP